MRDYLSFQNLRKAAVLSLFMVVLSAPRILLSGFPFSFVVAAYAGLICFGGMATAWSREAGMHGLFPEKRRMLRGLLAALAILIVMVPMQVLVFNPLLYMKIAESGDTKALELLFPATLSNGLALMMWAMSFETLFFQAAAMSFFARLTRRLSFAVIFALLLRVFVAGLKLDEAGILPGSLMVLALVGLGSVVSSLLFAFYGLPAAMLLAAGLSLSRWIFVMR